jgi:hypothetical protein
MHAADATAMRIRGARFPTTLLFTWFARRWN